MFFYMPTKVYQEQGAVTNHAAEWCQVGHKALIVTGRSSSKKNGSLQDVCEALESQRKTYVIFNGVEENPSVNTVLAASALGVEEECDFVIGIGGGSPLDAAKAIAFMIFHKSLSIEMLYTSGDDRALPVIAVPTTCGTGSEATPYSILTRPELKSKGSIPHKIFPIYALVDGRYLRYAPKQVLHNTAIDAMGHFYESYVNRNATPYSKMLVEKGLQIWAKGKSVFLGEREPEDEDYEQMMLASTIAGMAISITSTTLPHGLSYPLTCYQDMAHGMGVGYFQAGYLREADKKDRDALMQLSGFESVDEMDAFYQQICQPEKQNEEMLQICADSIASNEAKLQVCPFLVDREVLCRIVGLR